MPKEKQEIPAYLLEIVKGVLEKNPKNVYLSRPLQAQDQEPMAEIPFELLGNLAEIQSFTMGNHALETLSPRIAEMKALAWLDLHDNPLIEIPEEIGHLQNLKYLRLSDTGIVSAIGSLFSVGNPFTFTGPNGLRRLPGSIKQLQELEALRLDGNRFEVIPPEIFELKKLNYLDLGFNFLRVVPPEIGKLTELTYLKLSYNYITELPETIGCLKKLERLRIDGLDLSCLPESIGELTNLNMMEICWGRVGELPASIKQLKGLKQLYLYGTALSDIDRNMLKVFLPQTEIHWKMG